MRLRSPVGRWVLATTVLGSAMAVLDSTVVNVALPTIGRELHAGVSGMQWVVNAYLLTLSAFVLVGGSLGDRFGRRRVFVVGVAWFAAASLLCGLAPTMPVLGLARALQGVGGALLTPGSLALIQAAIHRDDRSRAVGLWSGLSGIAALIGPFAGGVVIAAISWRWLFLVNVPLAGLVVLAARHVPESRDEATAGSFDLVGAGSCALALAGITYALIEAEAARRTAYAALAVGVVAGLGFVLVERRSRFPMMPLALFRSREFAAANLITLAAYAALSGTLFSVVLYLQVVAGYSPQRAGLALLPATLVMLSLSSWIGGMVGKLGARWLLCGGSLIAAVAELLFARVGRDPTYVRDVLPAALLFGLGMTGVAVPVTVTVLASIDPARSGIASGVNNAVARAAGLLAIAALPLATGLSGERYAITLPASYPQALRICAALFVLAALGSALLLRGRTSPR